MRVCIDCSPLLVRSSGVKTYIHQLAQHLRTAHGRDAVRMFPHIADPGELNHENPALTAGTLTRIGLLTLINRGLLPAGFVVPGVDLFHASNLIHNPPRKAKLTATIHDVTSWLRPDLHLEATVRADEFYLNRIWKKADGLIAVSEKSRQDAIETLGFKPDRIVAIHNGVADAYFHVRDMDIDEVRRVYAIRRSYVLFVSTIEPRKNLDRLVSAYEQLSHDLLTEFELLIAGPAGWQCEATLRRIQQYRGGVRYLGYVPERYMAPLFAGAAVFAYPSLYEGFGLPVAQAMATGTPVLTSPVGALPEVAGDCAVYADPCSIAELKTSLERLLLSPSQRTELARLGKERAARFTWTTCAARTWTFFRHVTGL